MTDLVVTPAEKRLTLAALAVVVLLSALDQTIVSTAMPRIIEQLQGLSMYAWVTTAYMLTSTVSVPIYGKLSDQYGRKGILILGVVLFLAGSVLCGLSGEFGELPLLGSGMMQLIVFRAIQGLGAGALMTVSFAIMADMYPPRERGRLFGVFGSVFGIATVVGPFIGGFLTDHGTFQLLGHEVAGWRWVFYVNLPLGMVALFMIMYRMPVLRHGAGGRIDYLGAVLVVLMAATLLLGLSLGGTSYAWDSPVILALFACGGVSLAVFLWVETRATNPILPLHLFHIHAFRMTALASFVMSTAFLGVVMFMPLYMQVVQGINATQSGFALLPLMGGLIVSSITCGRLVTRTGRYKAFMIGGGIVLIAGVIALTGIGPDTTSAELTWRLILTGVGLGPAQTLFNLVIQNSAPPAEIGVATSTGQFARQMGATVGVAIFGTFLTHGLTEELPKHVPMLPGVSQQRIDLAHAQSQAMNADVVRLRVESTLEERFAVLERAYHEDPAAVAEIVGDPRMPEQIKKALRDGGVRSRVHAQLVHRAETVESELNAGEEGRERLLKDPELPAGVKQQLADIPLRALREPELIANVARLFREAILSKEDALVASTAQQSLLAVHAAMSIYGKQLVERIQRGMKVAFSTAIVQMLKRALWIVGLAVTLVLFIPEVPLRARAAPAAAAAAD
ncbi:MAG TPA: MDR family MFS transporter [Steroidobacteraceae bacterium]|nr:MDR family MFS transporter [Steroidobacteraceae bacterium]